MHRRKFATGLTAIAVAWSLPARSQQQIGRVHHVSVLMLYPEADPAGQARAGVFQQSLEKLGWTVGRSLSVDFHWGVGDDNWLNAEALNMVKEAPDIIVANGVTSLRAVQRATTTTPVVFIGGADPVSDGFVKSLSHPGTNMTGFTVLEPSVGAKLLELLKEMAPNVTRVSVLLNAESSSSQRLFASASAAAQRFSVEIDPVHVRNSGEIEAAMAKLAQRALDAGIIVPPDPLTNTHRQLIATLCSRYRLPAIYALRTAILDGGLFSYGVDIPELFRQAAGYVDRILRGEETTNLPVQQPTKFELVINLKTAKALELVVPPTLLARADEVIE